jgi:hypothetical protein
MAENFEVTFRECVKSVGGEVLPENAARSADFLFSPDNVVVELKTLQEDARREHAEKLQFLVNDWMKRGLMLVFGRAVISLPKLNPVCQREWLEVLQAPVENIVRDANRQIRSTKQATGRQSARGLLLIANDGNFLHTSPIDYMNIVARVLKKKTSTGTLRFPNIHGVAYFSYRIPSAAERTPFWVAGTVDDPTRDTEMCNFQLKLQNGWFDHVSRVTGMPVLVMPASISQTRTG